MGSFNAARLYRHSFTGEFALDPHNPFLPFHLRAAIKQRDRHIEADRPRRLFRSEHETITRAYQALQEQCAEHQSRRAAEKTIAAYIEDQVLPTVPPDALDYDALRWLPRDLRECRKSGAWGLKPDGGLLVAWDSKCGDRCLCPDEAREEQQRLSEKYLPQLVALDAAGYKIQKAVISPPNFADGSLAKAQRYAFNRFRAMLRKMDNGERAFPIAGALVVMESPLSSRGDWNVHLNVFFVIEPGQFFDWSKFREAIGGWQCEFVTKQQMIETTERRLVRRGDNLASLSVDDVFAQALLECIKYPVQTVADKSGKHAGEWRDGVFVSSKTNKPVAPPMTSWPAERFLEWYRAQKGFRRTRGYGKDVLFGVAAPERDKLSLDDVTFYGTVKFCGSGYIASLPPIDLIPGDKSTNPSDRVDGEVDNRGPPDKPLPFRERVALEIIDQELTEAGL